MAQYFHNRAFISYALFLCIFFIKKEYPLRNLSLFLVITWVLSSCSTTKPATVVRTKDSGSSGSNPQFIESIKVSPSGDSKKAPANGYNSISQPIDKTS